MYNTVDKLDTFDHFACCSAAFMTKWFIDAIDNAYFAEITQIQYIKKKVQGKTIVLKNINIQIGSKNYSLSESTKLRTTRTKNPFFKINLTI